MRHMGGLMDQWVNSVRVTREQAEAAPVDQSSPYGTPSESIGYLQNQARFETIVTRAQPENAAIKSPGNDGIVFLDGYDHLSEVMENIVADQMRTNPLYRHAKILLTYRQNPTAMVTDNRTVHVDPSRTQGSVVEDYVYFVSNIQGTISQAQHVVNPIETLNKMKPEAMVEEGLMVQAKPFEIVKGRESTYHTQGAKTYEPGRTFARIIVTHPDIQYFHNLPDSEKAALPADFREKHGIETSVREWNLH